MDKALKSFSKTIKKLRKERNLTQEKLSELSKRHPVYISKIERGIKNPTLDSILQLCQGLQIEPADLMNLAFKPEFEQQELKQQILMLISKLNAKELKKNIFNY